MNSEEDLDANDFYGHTPRTNATTTVDEDLEAHDGDDDDDDDDYDYETALSENINITDNPSQLHQYSLHDDVRANPAWPLSYGVSMDLLSTSPSIGFLGWSSPLARKASQTSLPYYSSLTRPLIDSSSSKELPPTPTATATSSAVKLSGFSNPRLSSNHLIATPDSDPQCSTAQSVFNGVNVLCGIGLLTIPYAIMQGGWLGLSQLLIFGAIAYYTAILLMRCLESGERSIRTYPDIGQAAFGSSGRINVSVTLYLELFGTCVEFIIMMSDNLTMLFPNASLCLFGGRLVARQLFTILSSLIVLPSVWLKDLSMLSYFSVGGVAASILIGLCLLWIGVVDDVGFHATGSAINFSGLYATIGIYAYAFSGHSVFPNIYTSMKEPSRFPFVLVVSFVSCLLISIAVGACGYLMFGDSIESQLTLSMPKQLVASKIAVWTMVFMPLTKYALTISPVAMSLEELLPLSLRKYHSVSILVRSLLVLSTLIVALTIPFFASVMALLGSICSMLVSFIFPCACYLSLYRGRLTTLQIASCVFIIIIATVCSYLGTYSAVADLIAQQNRA